MDMNQFVINPNQLQTPIQWKVEYDAAGPILEIDENGYLHILPTNQVGIFGALLHVSDDSVKISQSIRIKVSHFFFRYFFFPKPLVFSPFEEIILSRSLYLDIYPADFPREQIAFEIMTLPRGMSGAKVLSDGRLWLKAGNIPPTSLGFLPVFARYQSPTSTPTPTLWWTPTPTGTPFGTQKDPETVRDPSEYRDPEVNWTPSPAPSPFHSPTLSPALTPTPTTLLELVSDKKLFQFHLQSVEPIGPHPLDLAVLDWNRDGYHDFLTADFGMDTASLLLSQGNVGTYQRVTLEADGDGCMNAVVEDLDGDGWEEILLLSAYDSRIRIYWGNQTGLFETKTDID